MKKWMLTLSAALLTATGSFAQAYFELMPSAGYTFSNRINDGNTYGKIDGNFNFGGSLMFNVNRRLGFEMLYNHLGTNSGEYYYDRQSPISKANLTTDNIMFGPVGTIDIPGSPVRPFFGGLMGATIFTPGATGYSNDTRFTVGAEFGANVYFNPWFGLRFKAQLLAPLDASGQGFYVGDGYSGGTSSSGIVQFSLNAGLVIGLGRIMPEHILRPHPVKRVYRYQYYPPPYRY